MPPVITPANGADELPRTITVTGEGTASGRPDEAVLSLGVQANGRTAAEALNTANASAGKKAFITTRVGDAGFLLGMFLLYWATGTLEIYGEVDAPALAGDQGAQDAEEAVVVERDGEHHAAAAGLPDVGGLDARDRAEVIVLARQAGLGGT